MAQRSRRSSRPRRASFRLWSISGCAAAGAVLLLASFSVPVFSDEETSPLAGDKEEVGRRRTQFGPAPPKPLRDAVACARSTSSAEELTALCGTAAGRVICPITCANAAPAPPAAACDELVNRGELVCREGSAGADFCPDACANSVTGAPGVPGAFTRTDGVGVFQTSCIFLLMLPGGCAYDLSERDTTLAYGTHVSTVCPIECSGHSQCVDDPLGVTHALDVAFLDSQDDSSHAGTIVREGAQGGACVDGGGVTFNGEGWATITPGQHGDHGNKAEFSLAFWMLPVVEDVWTPNIAFNLARTLYVHAPRSRSSVAGGISLSLSRGVWLGAWVLHASISGTYADYSLDVLRDATPKWTHIVIVVKPTEIRVYEDGELIQDTEGRDAVSRVPVGTMDLASELHIGGLATVGGRNFQGSIAMLQLFATALSGPESGPESDVQCVFDGGRELVQNQRMAQPSRSACRGPVTTGCTNGIADNFETLSVNSIDDGSCLFGVRPRQATVGELRAVRVTDNWQRVDLSGSYTNPIVLCGVVTRESTTQAVVRVRNVRADPQTGAWYFEVVAEQKHCHFAQPPPISELVDFIVVEAGVSAEGWQAGIVRVHDTEWHRTSYLQEPEPGASPVVISQVKHTTTARSS